MSLNNGKIWIPLLSLLLALGGAYLSAQVSIAQQLGDKVNRQELKEAVHDTREQIRRELNDIKENQKATSEEIKETNRLLRELILKDQRERR